jgi:hypothetical protein
VGHQPASTSTALTLDSTNDAGLIQVRGTKPGTWTVEAVASNVSAGLPDFGLAALLV